ncbi:MAG: DUF2807 domain-containing protein [Bacteroidota bacterium]|nr:DUF2807 domain-containing protein [Bacteroidota bacterium]
MKIKFFSYLFITSFLFACTKENALDCFKSNGKETTEFRYPGSFSIIKTYDKIDVKIVKGTEYKVEINAGSNLMSSIKTTVSNGTLTIQNKNKCNFVRGYKKTINVIVTLPRLAQVENLGVGTINFDQNFSQDTLFVRAENSGDTYLNGTFYLLTTSSHGDGNIIANGTCNTLYVYINGTNFFNGENLTVTNYAFIESFSIANAHIKSPNNGTFECNIHSDGNVFYTGNPLYINDYSDKSAKGKLIKN